MDNWSTFGWYGYAHQPDEVIDLGDGERKEVFYRVDDVIEVVYDVESREQAKEKCKMDLKLLQESYEISE